MQRFVQVNDVHLSDQPPRRRTASYLDDVLAKLHAASQLAWELDAGLIITGDLFHRKNAAHTTHRTVQRVREALVGRTWIVPGNHDEAHGGGLDGQPLLSVLDGDFIRDLIGRAADANLTVHDGSRPVDFAGVAWSNAFEGPDGADVLADAIIATRAPLVFCHAPITDHPFPFGPEERGWIMDVDLATRLAGSGVRLVAHGHMHGQQPVQVLDGITFSNPGALARASIAEHDLHRKPAVAIIEVDGDDVRVEYRTVPHRPADEVLRVEVHEREQQRDAGVAALAQSLHSAYAEAVDEEVLRVHLGQLERPDDVDPEVWRLGIEMAGAAIDGVEP